MTNGFLVLCEAMAFFAAFSGLDGHCPRGIGYAIRQREVTLPPEPWRPGKAAVFSGWPRAMGLPTLLTTLGDANL